MHQPPRRMELSSLQDTVLVCAVVTVLVIRLQLWITNYPQLGGGKLHVAHLLWGGLLMLIAIGLLLSYMGPKVRRTAAVLGGIGFGFFVDELGKFITSDNDYFFKPAAGVIYMVFVLLFFFTRWLRRRGTLTPEEALVNAADIVSEAALHDLDARERERALELLAHCDARDPLVKPLRALMIEIQSLPVRPPGRLTRWARWIRAHYYRVIDKPWFPRVLRIVFTLLGILALAQVLWFVFDFFVVSHGDHVDLSVSRGLDGLSHVSLYPRYTELARNTRGGDGGASADVCNSNAGAEPCLNMVNKGNGFAAAFRTRGTQGFRLQTSGQGQATPFILDANATGKVQFLNADEVDGLDSTQLQAQFAVVNADGSLSGTRGATASARVSDGTYDVTFGGDISSCVYTANETTVNDAGAVAVQRQSPTVIRVATRKGGGADGTGPSDRQNRPFNLVVNC